MNIPLEFFILFASVIGAGIGILGTRLYYQTRVRGKERETWRKAEVFFKALHTYQNSKR